MERFRNLNELFTPDTRSEGYSTLSVSGTREKTLEDHWKLIDEIRLNTNVPEEIQTHFETARNLLLYAWFVYREHQKSGAKQDHLLQVLNKTEAENLDSCTLDDDESRFEGMSADPSFDYLKLILKTIPTIRDHYRKVNVFLDVCLT